MACQRLSSHLSAFRLPIRTRPSLHSSHNPSASSFKPSITLSSTPVRYASHAEQGRANGVKDGRGRRLGAKKTAGELVVPGNIIFRQRGTKWHPGDNTQLGRDHTIHSTIKGYVRYYRDPVRHPKRRYIGVVFEKDQQLPVDPKEPRRRRLNMIAVPFKEDSPYAKPLASNEITATKSDGTVLRMRSNYMFKEANWEIGRAAEKAGVNVTPFKKNDRWLAWKKRAAKADKVLELKAAQREKKIKKAANKAKGLEFARNKGKQIKATDKAKAKLT